MLVNILNGLFNDNNINCNWVENVLVNWGLGNMTDFYFADDIYKYIEAFPILY